jgi:iron complex outermembrane receptor protein
MVRGTFAEGFRAPSISDLYGGLGTSFETYVDPCGIGATNSVNGNAPATPPVFRVATSSWPRA